MPATGQMNMEDPTLQEKIRRGSHEYVPGDGRHGTYKPKAYVHQEYPKFMVRDDEKSIVRSRVEEDAWIATHPAEEKKRGRVIA